MPSGADLEYARLLAQAGVSADDAAGYDGAFLEQLSSLSLTPRNPTIVLFGDSRTDDCDLGTGVSNDSTLIACSSNMSWFDWGQLHLTSGPVFDVLKNAGKGGDTTLGMLNRMDSDVLSYRPGYLTLWGGTNDNWTSTSDVDLSFNRMVAMVKKAHNAGIYVFLISEITKSLGGTFPGLCQYYNDRLRSFCSSNPNVEFWDFNSIIMDPASATGVPKSGLLRDGTHLSTLGASTLGKTIVAPALSRFNALSSLPNSLIDTKGNNNNVLNVLSNILMTASGGTNGAGDSGSLPSGWTATQSGSNPTAVHSLPARSDGFGNDLQAVITASGSGGKFYTCNVSTSRLTKGKAYVLEASVGIDNPVNLTVFSLMVQLNGSPSYQRGWGTQEQAVTADNVLPLTKGVLRSRIFTIPPSMDLTSCTVQFTCRFGAAGGATVRLGRISLKEVLG